MVSILNLILDKKLLYFILSNKSWSCNYHFKTCYNYELRGLTSFAKFCSYSFYFWKKPHIVVASVPKHTQHFIVLVSRDITVRFELFFIYFISSRLCSHTLLLRKIFFPFLDFMILKVHFARPPAGPSCCCAVCLDIDSLSSEGRMQAHSVTLCLELIICFVPEALPLNHSLQSHRASQEREGAHRGEGPRECEHKRDMEGKWERILMQ